MKVPTLLFMQERQITPGQRLAKYLESRHIVDTRATEFIVHLSSAPVILTAPHTAATFRDGEYKQRDNNVGILALEAGRQAGVSVLLPTTAGDHDGNWSEESAFRRLLLALGSGHTLIDIHGMADAHGYDVIVGTAGGATPPWLSELAAASCRDAGLSVDVRDAGPLSAGERTLTALANAQLAGGVQLEIAKRWRSPRTHPAAFSTIVDVVASIASSAAAHVSS